MSANDRLSIEEIERAISLGRWEYDGEEYHMARQLLDTMRENERLKKALYARPLSERYRDSDHV